MDLTAHEVRRIASLARLRLSPAEEQRFAVDLGRVVRFFDRLADSATADALEGGESEAVPEAEDRSRQEGDPELLLANAPELQEGFVAVPKVVGDG